MIDEKIATIFEWYEGLKKSIILKVSIKKNEKSDYIFVSNLTRKGI